MRPAKAQGHTKALGAADGHISLELARWGQQGQGQQVCRHRHQRIGVMEPLHHLPVIEDTTGAGGVLQQGAEERAGIIERLLVAYHHLDAQGLCAGTQYIEGLRVAMHRGEEAVAGLVLRQALAERHGFGSRRGFIEQRSIGDR